MRVDEKVINFTINNQINSKSKHKGMSRQDKFDATYAPQLHFYIDKLRTLAKTLVEKKLLDDDILEGFCKLKGTDVKLPSNKGKKKKKKMEAIEDDDAIVPQYADERQDNYNMNAEPEPDGDDENSINEDANENEEVDNENENGMGNYYDDGNEGNEDDDENADL